MFLSGVIGLWYLLTIMSCIFLVYDQYVNTPSAKIMACAWFLVILYTGPIGLFFYFLSCRQPLPGTHDSFIKAHWKQALGSEIHCVAGDATGIIISAFIISFFRIPNGTETIIEYIFAYLFGLLIFQALFMLPMYKNYGQAVLKTIFSETVSMNFVMIGMLPLVIILRHIWPKGLDPANLEFWFIMSLSTLGGFIIGYPINSYLVKKGEKHGMMTKSMSHAGHKNTSSMSTHSSNQNNASEGSKCCSTHKHSASDDTKHKCCGTCGGSCDSKIKDTKNTPMDHENHHANHEKIKHEHNHEMMHANHDHMNHQMQGQISIKEKWAWTIGSYILLIAVFFVMSIWIPIRF